MNKVTMVRRDPGRYFGELLRRVPVDSDGAARIGSRQIYILPTLTGVWYGAAVLLTLLGSLNYQNNLGLLFAFFLTGVGIAAMHHCWFNLLGLVVTARAGPPVFAGSTATFEVTLCNERRRPRYDVRLAGMDQTAHGVFLDSQEQRVLVCARPALARGWLHLRELTLETRHPMHLFRAWCYPGSDAAALVYPHPAPSAPPPAADGGVGRVAAPRAGEGRDDYLGPRPYRAGDSPRHIDWKAVARERGLVVKQFGGQEGQDLWIDWDRVSAADSEVRIGLLTRQVIDAAAADLRFALRLPGVEIALNRGDGHCQHCLRTLALWNCDAPAQQTQRVVRKQRPGSGAGHGAPPR